MSLAAWMDALPERLDPVLADTAEEEETPMRTGDFLTDLAGTSLNYQQVWERMVDSLRRMGVREGLPSEQAAIFKQLAGEAEAVAASHQSRLLRRGGVRVEPPLDRAITRVCSLQLRVPPDELTAAQREMYMQGLYDGIGIASHVIARIAAILGRQEGEADRFLAAQLAGRTESTAARSLSARGVRLRDPLEVAREVGIQKGDRQMGIRGRRTRLEKLSRLSAMKREALRIERAEGSDWRFAGRRKGVRDARRHHPFLSSTAAANLARRLTREGKPWLYREHYLLIDVPAEIAEGTGRHVIGLEPDFSFPGVPHKHIVLIPDRRFGGDLGSAEERRGRIELVQRLRPDLDIQAISVAQLRNGGAETEYAYLNKDRTTTRIPGRNIDTEPDRFLMEENKCPCPSCRIGRGQSAVQKKPERGRPVY